MSEDNNAMNGLDELERRREMRASALAERRAQSTAIASFVGMPDPAAAAAPPSPAVSAPTHPYNSSMPSISASSMNVRPSANNNNNRPAVFSNMSEEERQRRYNAKMAQMGITDTAPEKPELTTTNTQRGSSAINPAGQVIDHSMSTSTSQYSSSTSAPSSNLSSSMQSTPAKPRAETPAYLIEQERQRRYDAKMAEFGLVQPEPEKEITPVHPDSHHHVNKPGVMLEDASEELYAKDGYSQPTQFYGQDSPTKEKGDTENNLNYAYHQNNPNQMMNVDLAVAMVINEDEMEGQKEKEAMIASAVEYDPDSKPPLHKNRRFQLYGVICLLLLAVISAGAAIGVGGGEETTSIGERTIQGGALGPTNAPTMYLKPQEQLVYNFLALHFSPKVWDEGTPHHMAAQWALYEDPYSQAILQDLLPNARASLDVQFLQRYVLAFLWFHSTNMGKDAWRSCNPPTFQKIMGNDSMVTPSSVEDDREGDTCTFLQWNKLENDDLCFGAVEGANRWMSSVDTCKWQGVDCSTGTEVLGLDLVWQGLSGTLPTEIVALTSLQTISFASNQFTGTIPSEYARLRTLFALELHRNLLTGSIPEAYYEAASETGALVLLNVGDNQLTGTLDTRIGLMTDLKGLHFFDNRFTGTIPTEIGNLRYLSYSRGYGNQLLGSLPTEFGKLHQINEFWYYQMGLTGPIPSEFGNMKRLQSLRLWGQDLTGPIPKELYSLRKLSDVALQENKLTGTISTSISNMLALEALRVSSNKLDGTIPTEVGDLFSLKVAWFHQNDLTGTMPTEVCNRGLIGLQADCESEGAAAVECDCCSSCCEQGLGLGTCFFREGYGEPTLSPNTFDAYVTCDP